MNEALINPEIAHWARERGGLAYADLAEKMNKFPETIAGVGGGENRITFRQSRKLAGAFCIYSTKRW